MDEQHLDIMDHRTALTSAQCHQSTMDPSPNYPSQTATADLPKKTFQHASAFSSSQTVVPSGEQTWTPMSPVIDRISWDDRREKRNPRHWSMWARLYHTVVSCILTFQIVFSTSITVPATFALQASFDVTRTQALLPTCLYTLGLAFGPVIIASFSEVFGRKWIYVASQTCFLAFIGGAAAAPTFGALLVFRFLAGFLGSAAIAIAAGSISDVWVLHKSGSFASVLFILAPFLGPSLGPLAGAYILQGHGNDWRWTQYLLLMLGAPLWVGALFMKETSKAWITRHDEHNATGAPLQRTVTGARLRGVLVGALTRPTRMLFTEVVVLSLTLYTGYAYAMIFSYFASCSYVLILWYGFDLQKVGLSLISVIIGYLLATALFGVFDRTFYARARAAAGGGPPNPKHRLYSACVGSIFLPVGLFWYAWAAKAGGHWAVVVAAGIPFGLGAFSLFLSAIAYMVDFYGPEKSASAIAANGLLRYILGATFPLFTLQMYEKLGVHWAGSVFAFLSLLLVPIPWLLFVYSERLQGHTSNENRISGPQEKRFSRLSRVSDLEGQPSSSE